MSIRIAARKVLLNALSDEDNGDTFTVSKHLIEALQKAFDDEDYLISRLSDEPLDLD